MSTMLNLSKRSLSLIILTVFIISICSTRAAINEPYDMEESEEAMEYRRREADFKKFKHFLLTSNDDQRAARREKQLLNKRKLIQEYLESLKDPDVDRAEQMKKRFTYCPIEDLIGGSLCRRNINSD